MRKSLILLRFDLSAWQTLYFGAIERCAERIPRPKERARTRGRRQCLEVRNRAALNVQEDNAAPPSWSLAGNTKALGKHREV